MFLQVFADPHSLSSEGGLGSLTVRHLPPWPPCDVYYQASFFQNLSD